MSRSYILAFFTLLLALLTFNNACAVAAPITLAEILQAAQLTIEGLKLVRQFSSETSLTVSKDYSDLGQLLKVNTVDTPHVVDMESRYADMQQKSARFSQALTDTQGKADRLFSLLQKRANQVSTAEIKTRMLDDTAHKKSEFYLKLDLAKNGVATLNGSIKKYDDIIAFMQTRVALNTLNNYMDDVSQTAAQAAQLNLSIKTAIDQGIALVVPIQDQSEIVKPADPAPIPVQKTSQTALATQIREQTAIPPILETPRQQPNTTSAASSQTPAVPPSTQQGTAALPVSNPSLAVSALEPMDVPPSHFPPQAVLAQGTRVWVKLLEPIPFGLTAPEYSFKAALSEPISADGRIVAEAGSLVSGKFRETANSSHSFGDSRFRLQMTLDSIGNRNGAVIAVETYYWEAVGYPGNGLHAGARISFTLAKNAVIR